MVILNDKEENESVILGLNNLKIYPVSFYEYKSYGCYLYENKYLISVHITKNIFTQKCKIYAKIKLYNNVLGSMDFEDIDVLKYDGRNMKSFNVHIAALFGREMKDMSENIRDKPEIKEFLFMGKYYGYVLIIKKNLNTIFDAYIAVPVLYDIYVN